jgi:HAD superfamily hydrolase (TIGR01509 family)
VLLLDVMSTLVRDPFYEDVPRLFGASLDALVSAKDPHAWPAFECDAIDEGQLAARFFLDRREVDVTALKRTMADGYAWLEGVEPLLAELSAAGVEMHALSNYPHWYTLIEEKLQLRRYLRWTFVSCKTGLRKPDVQAYRHAAAALGVQPGAVTFVDDRRDNCEAAAGVGMAAVHFTDGARLRRQLADDGWPVGR